MNVDPPPARVSHAGNGGSHRCRWLLGAPRAELTGPYALNCTEPYEPGIVVGEIGDVQVRPGLQASSLKLPDNRNWIPVLGVGE